MDQRLRAVTVCVLLVLAEPLLYAEYAVEPMTTRLVRLEIRENQVARTMEIASLAEGGIDGSQTVSR
jgi:hypothetical protein